jgi:hypothetical protein
MRKCGLHLLLAIAVTAALGAGFDLAGNAAPWWPGSSREGLSAAAPGLVLQAKKKHCERVFVCDYFAPANSCATPPCCKKGHSEKHCEKESNSTSGDSMLKSHPCYSICQDQCSKTRSDMTPDQCIEACLETTRC